MIKLLFVLHRFFPKFCEKMLRRDVKLLLVANNFFYNLVNKKDLADILPYLDLDFLKSVDINLKVFSYFLFEKHFSANESKNKILTKICRQLIDRKDMTKNEKLEYFLDGVPCWIYSLVDISVLETDMADTAYNLLQNELSVEDAFLTEDVVATMQLAYLMDKNIQRINFEVFLCVFLKTIDDVKKEG